MNRRAIIRIQAKRATLHAFEVSGKISKSDIEHMADDLQTAFRDQNRVDVLIIIKDWGGIDLDAVFDAKAISVQAKSNKHIRKYGVVGAPGWAAAMINLFSPLTPVEEKTFDLHEVDQAWEWVSI